MAKGKYEYWLTPDGLLRLEAYARDGLTDELIAKKMDIGARTLYEWKERYPQIVQSLKRGKEVVDIEVENKLLQRATGYSYEEVTTERRKIDEDYYEMVETKRVTKEVQPDVTAQIFWLKNRKSAEWRDTQKIESTNININDDVSGLTDEEIAIELAKLGFKKD